MKAASYTHFGEPAVVLTVIDVARPEPKPDEVLIRTILSPIHNHDLWTIRGTYGYKPELPALGGSEAVGTVEAVGEGVDAAMIGKRVVNAGKIGTWDRHLGRVFHRARSRRAAAPRRDLRRGRRAADRHAVQRHLASRIP